MAKWNIKGTYVEACNCEAICPCIFFSPPTEGSCTVLIGWQIDEGAYEEVSLNGMNTAVLAHSPGHMKDGGWKVALYVDDRADEAQNQALMGIFSGQAGGHLANLGPLIGEVLGARAGDYRLRISGGQFLAPRRRPWKRRSQSDRRTRRRSGDRRRTPALHITGRGDHRRTHQQACPK